MLWYLKTLISSVREGVNHFKQDFYLKVMIHRHEMELERRRVLRRGSS
jgi:hypothetical protein